MRKLLLMSALILGMAALTTTEVKGKLPEGGYLWERPTEDGGLERMYPDRSIYYRKDGGWIMIAPPRPGANPAPYPWEPNF